MGCEGALVRPCFPATSSPPQMEGYPVTCSHVNRVPVSHIYGLSYPTSSACVYQILLVKLSCCGPLPHHIPTMPLNNARPALSRSISSSGSMPGSRPFSIAIPARLATESRHFPKPRGFLADKGPFPFRERATSYESIHSASISRSMPGSNSAELEMLRTKTVEQKRKIESLQRAISELVGERGQ
ncbi:hypothetical protein BJX63DRAFT_138019 [Aspergillus granulosus]|uniref:Uncharacterized protein n=1 Tax=Aspergillus granulosus TaxID=176169 RepID=A0ABR4HLY7_9EURO